jgi:hypothetical protein
MQFVLLGERVFWLLLMAYEGDYRMARFYQPDLSENIDSPFVRDGADKLIRRSYWLDMDDRLAVFC